MGLWNGVTVMEKRSATQRICSNLTYWKIINVYYMTNKKWWSNAVWNDSNKKVFLFNCELTRKFSQTKLDILSFSEIIKILSINVNHQYCYIYEFCFYAPFSLHLVITFTQLLRILFKPKIHKQIQASFKRNIVSILIDYIVVVQSLNHYYICILMSTSVRIAVAAEMNYLLS